MPFSDRHCHFPNLNYLVGRKPYRTSLDLSFAAEERGVDIVNLDKNDQIYNQCKFLFIYYQADSEVFQIKKINLTCTCRSMSCIQEAFQTIYLQLEK